MDTSLNDELARLRKQGVTLPYHPDRAADALRDGYQFDREIRSAAASELKGVSLKLGRTVTDSNYDSPEVQKILNHNTAMRNAMGSSRGLSVRNGMARESRVARQERLYPKLGATMGAPDAHAAIPRFYDPLEYWDLSGLPWNVADEGHRHKLHKWLRLYYATHYLIPILVDIFTRFPLSGMSLKCKDPQLKDFYEDLFFNQLHYKDFLVSLGREYWCVGEAFPLGSFDESLGVWEREELINPEDVVIENFPILGTQQLKLAPPDYLKRLAQTKNPAKEYRLLDANYPELIPYLLKGEHIPVSGVLMRQVANKLNDWDDHGTPILLRALRTLLHEEKLLASQDAIAERLYSPLLLAKLGIMDMGDGQPPWIPGPEELESVRDDLDLALSSDFRLMVHHFGLELENVFGREQMPRLGDDFDRIEKRLMQVFGVNPSLLSAGSGGQPYASSALQAEFMNQILRTFQQMLKDHFKERALVVAEAQGHYDYEQKGQTRVKLYEEIVEYDEDFSKSVVEVPKLLVPELEFQVLDMRDEATERQFMQSLRGLGVPISDEGLMVGNFNWDSKEEYKKFNEELKRKTIAQQRAKFETYTALTIQGLPVPADLKAEVESVLQPAGQAPQGLPMGGQQPPMPGGGAGPASGPGGIVMPQPPSDLFGGGLGPGGIGGPVPGGGPPPAGPIQPGPPGSVPEVSNERRPGLTYNTHTASQLMEDADKQVERGVSPNLVGRLLRTSMVNSYGATEDDAADLVSAWLKRTFAVLESQDEAEVDSEEEAATLTDSEDLIPVGEWELAQGQELRDKTEELPQRITRVGKRDVKYKIDPAKKYSIIDPEALEPLQDGETSESNTSESTRSRADAQSSEEEDRGRGD
jgi:hypothetical protein